MSAFISLFYLIIFIYVIRVIVKNIINIKNVVNIENLSETLRTVTKSVAQENNVQQDSIGNKKEQNNMNFDDTIRLNNNPIKEKRKKRY